MTIQLIEYTKDWIPEKEGKYLVRTESNLMKSINFFSAYVFKNGKVDVTNQKVTHISKEPIQ